MQGLKIVVKEHISNLGVIGIMSVKTLKRQYSGTTMGIAWSVIKNLIFVGAYWFALSVGLKGGADVDYPYMAWLVTGLAAWFFIKDSLSTSAKSIRKEKHLVTKIKFPVSIMPTYNVLANVLSSLMFIGIVFLISYFVGVDLSLYWIQIFYYLFAGAMLLCAIGILTSALVVVSKDVGVLIDSTVFVLFWVSPILFPVSNVSENLQMFLKINPFTYIIEGFRASILYKTPFWEEPTTLYFWAVVLIVFLIGSFLHGKLRNQFADVL